MLVGKREFLIPALVYLCMMVLFAPDAVFGDGVFWFHDLRHHHYPWRVWAAQSWASGEIPWWAPGAANGFPLLAEGQGGFLYLPTMLLFLLVSPPSALNWALLLHHFWAALGMHAFVSALGLKKAAPYVAGIAWGWSGFLASHSLYLGMQNGLSWLGWAAFAAITGRWWLVALSIGALGVAGHPQGAAFGGLLLGAHAMLALQGKNRLWWVLAAGVGILMALPQLLASLELSRFSMREGGVDMGFAGIGVLPPQELVNAVLPYFFGYDRPSDIAETYYHRGQGYWGQGVNHWEMSFYIGFPWLVLAIVGVRQRTALWAAGAGLFLLLMLGGPLWALVRLLPGFEFFRFPARFALCFSFCMAVLAAYGAETIRTAARIPALQRIPMLLGGGLLAGMFLLGVGVRLGENFLNNALTEHFSRQVALPEPPEMPFLLQAALPPPEPENPAEIPAKVAHILESLRWDTTRGLLWPLCSLLMVGMAMRRPVFLPALLALDLWSFGHNYQERLDRKQVLLMPSWLSVGMTEAGGPRLTVLDRRSLETLDARLLSASLGLIYGTSDVIIPSPLLILRNEAMLALVGLDVGDKGPQKIERYLKNQKLAQRMGVRFLATLHTIPELVPLVEGTVKLYLDPEALPRARVSRCWAGAEDGNTALKMLLEQELRVTVLEGVSGQGCEETMSPPVEMLSYRNKEVFLKATGPGVLVLSDSWYPGWKAEVDGEAAEILRADLLFRGVRLGPGEHTVRFSYQPMLLNALIALSGVLVFGCVGIGVKQSR